MVHNHMLWQHRHPLCAKLEDGLTDTEPPFRAVEASLRARAHSIVLSRGQGPGLASIFLDGRHVDMRRSEALREEGRAGDSVRKSLALKLVRLALRGPRQRQGVVGCDLQM